VLQGFGQDRPRVTSAQTADMEIALGRIAEREGNIEQAVTAYRQALKRDHRRADAYIRLAILHDQQGRFRESAELYQEALQLVPGDPDIICDMGYSLYLQRRWAEAEVQFRQAIVRKPSHARAHNNLALLLARNGRIDEALAEFHKGGNSHAQAQGNVAFVLTMEGRCDDAHRHYQLALVADPTSTEFQARLRQLDVLAAKLNRQQPHAVASADPLPRTRDAQVVTTAYSQQLQTSPPLPSQTIARTTAYTSILKPEPVMRPSSADLSP
jgi:tetratricopeptide (TPR) repeat protein